MKSPKDEKDLVSHIIKLKACRACSLMHPPSVTGGPVLSQVVLVGQAPGDKEPQLGRPFAWTAGKRLFQWLETATGWDEQRSRSSIYLAAVCRCFPGKKASGGDRVPSPEEIENCAAWMRAEFDILKPKLVIPVGKLAIQQFLPATTLADVIGKQFVLKRFGQVFDVIPLPHPSGASPWHHQQPGKTLLRKALDLIGTHPIVQDLSGVD